uniref:PDZ domain-containing protein n=1 Tax=Odontella aurita TaxID=265563 RepID=A0A6U6LAX8_9STRA|mmetsp:Transcript_7364/g.21740  ORF Transcript_7364/g.21740 Transcript_7364/m.21740 type:complete len:706 (+) Transcript_7364:120-2237(+)
MHRTDLILEPRRLSDNHREDEVSASSSAKSDVNTEGEKSIVGGGAFEHEGHSNDSTVCVRENGAGAAESTDCFDAEKEESSDVGVRSLPANSSPEDDHSVSESSLSSVEDELSRPLPRPKGFSGVPPVEAFGSKLNESEETAALPSSSTKACNYEASIPVTQFGLLLKLRELDSAVTFDGYTRLPDGSQGPSELCSLIREIGDVIVAINGTCVEDSSYREVVNMLKEAVKKEEGLGFVVLGLMNGNEWLRRRDSVNQCTGAGQEQKIDELHSMALNVAYESLEVMRRANLEVEFGATCDFDWCTQCMRMSGTETMPNMRRRLKRLASKRRKSTACLLCASPSCAQHSMDSFRKESITVCSDCAPLFSHDFIVDILDITVSEDHRRQRIDHMVDVYDRAVLMLRYSAQFIDSIADALDRATKRNDKVGLGSSATGLVSGVTGVVGAATIFTPVGPPLLIASLFFGGSATAVQTGSEAVNYFSEPNKLADKIIALHVMVASLLETMNTLQSALLNGQVRVDQYVDETGDNQIRSDGKVITRNASVASVKYAGAASGAAAASRAGVLVGKNSRLATRASTTALRTARFARFAGGALSAATVVLEAREMSTTIKRIRNGNPCEKADFVRCIKCDLSELPDTNVLADECERYFEAMTSRPVSLAALVKNGNTKGNEEMTSSVNLLGALEDLERSSTRMFVSQDRMQRTKS